MRLIDADALKLSHCVECTLYPERCLGENCDWDSIYHLEHAPTIDPVKHGKWMEQNVTHEDNRRSTIIADWQSAKCSNCGKYHTTPYLYYFNHYNYCPTCGARMDERSEE